MTELFQVADVRFAMLATIGTISFPALG